MKGKVIFDTSIFIHANYHIICTYVKEEDIDSLKLAQKVAEQIESISFNKFEGHEIVLALDSKSIFRKTIDSNYKANRNNAKNFDKNIIHDYLKDRFNCIEFEGLEADDLVYLFSRKYDKTILVSQDNDYLLMLGQNRKLYKYRKDEFICLNAKQLLIEKLLKVCDGCNSDNIPKIKLKRFGRKLLEKLVDDDILFADYYLSQLQLDGYISNWETNFELALYDINIYYKYFGKETINKLIQKL